MGVFGKRLFEPSDFIGEFPIAAHEAELRRKQAGGGSFFFGYFLLAKQKKVTRVSRESDLLHATQCLEAIAP
ncbi:MAG: hypothetical protein K2Q33_04355 [Gammaproteobacteria bacterium]|nr:hypothetical protein [Gammaproteobacteria bacterium]